MSRLCANTRMEAAANRMADTVDRSRSRDQRIDHLRRLRLRAERAVAVECGSADDAVQILRFIIIAAFSRLSAFGMLNEAKSLCAAMSKGERAPAINHRDAANAEFASIQAANDRFSK